MKLNNGIALKTHKELIAWQKAYNLCLKTFKSTEKFPRSEQFGLTSQLKRSALSIPSNIAEGYNRGSTSEYIRLLYISYASLAELETQLMIAHDLGYIQTDEFNNLINLQKEVQRIMWGLIRSLS